MDVPGWSAGPTRECDVQRLRVLPVDPVADAAQPREVAQGCAAAGLLVTCEIVPRRAGGA